MPERSESEAYRRARKKVKKVRDFYVHLTIYLIVNTALVLIDLSDGTGEDTFLGLDWAYFPIIGWGIFVLIDAVSTFGFGGRFLGAEWEERKLEEYLEEDKGHEIRPE